MSWRLVFYKSQRGEKYVQRFILAQDAGTQGKIAKLLDLLSAYGPRLGMPYSRYLGSNLYELRVRGKNEVRIFYAFVTGEHEIVIVHAFNKRSQRLPERELAIARQRAGELTEL